MARTTRLEPARPGLLALVFVLAFGALGAEAGVRARVEPADGGQPRLPFLVTGRTHHYDLHNGNSRERGHVLTAPGRWVPVATGLRSPFTLAKVSVTAFHPAYLSASAESESWSGTLVGARMPVLAPEAWRDAIEAGPLPATGHGPTRARLADHVRVVVDYYLPHVDRSETRFTRDDFEALRDLVHDGMAGAPPDDRFAAEAARRLAEFERFLAHPLEARRFAALYRRAFGPKPLVEEYLDARDRGRILEFLDDRGPDEDTLRWFNETTSIHYTFGVGDNVHPKERPGDHCLRATLEADGGRAAGLDDGRMQTRAYTNLCRSKSASAGPWTWHGRYHPPGWP